VTGQRGVVRADPDHDGQLGLGLPHRFEECRGGQPPVDRTEQDDVGAGAPHQEQAGGRILGGGDLDRLPDQGVAQLGGELRGVDHEDGRAVGRGRPGGGEAGPAAGVELGVVVLPCGDRHGCSAQPNLPEM
jgi:hypothetical protein